MTCGRGGTGRRAALRSLWPKGRGSSSLLDRTITRRRHAGGRSDRVIGDSQSNSVVQGVAGDASAEAIVGVGVTWTAPSRTTVFSAVTVALRPRSAMIFTAA